MVAILINAMPMATVAIIAIVVAAVIATIAMVNALNDQLRMLPQASKKLAQKVRVKGAIVIIAIKMVLSLSVNKTMRMLQLQQPLARLHLKLMSLKMRMAKSVAVAVAIVAVVDEVSASVVNVVMQKIHKVMMSPRALLLQLWFQHLLSRALLLEWLDPLLQCLPKIWRKALVITSQRPLLQSAHREAIAVQKLHPLLQSR